MAEIVWYTSASGWMLQGPEGSYAMDSFHPCEEHEPEGDRGCERCDDGPMIEAGYYTTGYDGAGYPILNEDPETGETTEVAYVNYQTSGRVPKITATEEVE